MFGCPTSGPCNYFLFNYYSPRSFLYLYLFLGWEGPIRERRLHAIECLACKPILIFVSRGHQACSLFLSLQEHPHGFPLGMKTWRASFLIIPPHSLFSTLPPAFLFSVGRLGHYEEEWETSILFHSFLATAVLRSCEGMTAIISWLITPCDSWFQFFSLWSEFAFDFIMSSICH